MYGQPAVTRPWARGCAPGPGLRRDFSYVVDVRRVDPITRPESRTGECAENMSTPPHVRSSQTDWQLTPYVPATATQQTQPARPGSRSRAPAPAGRDAPCETRYGFVTATRVASARGGARARPAPYLKSLLRTSLKRRARGPGRPPRRPGGQFGCGLALGFLRGACGCAIRIVADLRYTPVSAASRLSSLARLAARHGRAGPPSRPLPVRRFLVGSDPPAGTNSALRRGFVRQSVSVRVVESAIRPVRRTTGTDVPAPH